MRLSVDHKHDPCKIGWSDWDAIWVVESQGLQYSLGPRSPQQEAAVLGSVLWIGQLPAVGVLNFSCKEAAAMHPVPTGTVGTHWHSFFSQFLFLPSVSGHCQLGSRNGFQSVKNLLQLARIFSFGHLAPTNSSKEVWFNKTETVNFLRAFCCL